MGRWICLRDSSQNLLNFLFLIPFNFPTSWAQMAHRSWGRLPLSTSACCRTTSGRSRPPGLHVRSPPSGCVPAKAELLLGQTSVMMARLSLGWAMQLVTLPWSGPVWWARRPESCPAGGRFKFIIHGAQNPLGPGLSSSDPPAFLHLRCAQEVSLYQWLP